MSSTKNRSNSHDLAKQTLKWLKTNQLDAIPSLYSVSYEHISGKNPGISHRLSQLPLKSALLEQELEKLYLEHFSNQNSDDRLEEFRNGLHQILQQALAITRAPRSETQHFQQALEKSRQALENKADDVDAILQVVGNLVTETKRMDESLFTMESKLRQTGDEVSILKEQFDQIRYEVFTDPLTGVLNRRGMDSSMRQLMVDNERQLKLSLLMIDLDNFKPFNDKHGHLVGDQVLCFAAKILKNATRGSDIIARYGGDEFAILLPNTNENEAKKVAYNILSALKTNKIKRRSSGEVLGTLSASVGVAELKDDETLEDLVERADKGLFASKRNGRNQVTALPKL
ncbi:MAG: GGDEF domain-containing protein [Halopseudomonas sp.]